MEERRLAVILFFELLDIPRNPVEFQEESEMFELKDFSKIF